MKLTVKKIALIMSLLPCFAMAQIAYTIKGKAPSLKDGDWVKLGYKKGNATVTDSVTVASGTFQFKGSVAEPVLANMYFNKGASIDLIMFYLEKGNISINSKSTITESVVTGGPKNKEFGEYYDMALRPVVTRSFVLLDKIQKMPVEEQNKPETKNYMVHELNIIDSMKKTLGKKFMETHPGSMMNVQIISNIDTTTAGKIALLDKLPPAVKSSKKWIEMKNQLDNIKNLAIGGTAPDFTLPDTSGKQIKLSSFRGKYVLLDFWASWCAPCRAENPNVVKAYNAYKNKNFTVVSVSMDDEKAKKAWMDAVHKDGLSWTQLCDLKGWDNLVGKLYGIRKIPSNFLIDPQGKILEIDLRGEKLNAALAKYIQ